MKFALLLASLCGALLLGGCADQSLLTDEQYANSRPPAPNGPDPARFLPSNGGRRY